mgnify:FL=1
MDIRKKGNNAGLKYRNYLNTEVQRITDSRHDTIRLKDYEKELLLLDEWVARPKLEAILLKSDNHFKTLDKNFKKYVSEINKKEIIINKFYNREMGVEE